MHVPIYEQHDGQAYDSFIQTTTRALVFLPGNNITAEPVKTTLRKVTNPNGLQGYFTRPLPVNYNKLTDEQLVTALKKAQYSYNTVSIAGERITL